MRLLAAIVTILLLSSRVTVSPSDSADRSDSLEHQKLQMEKLKLVVEVWKKTVDVQQHFNDIALRIRSFALTLLVGIFGGIAVALKDGIVVSAGPARLSLASTIILAGCVGWIGFWVLDRLWYHRLLVGAVKHGESIETFATDLPLGLTKQITSQSHIALNGVLKRWIAVTLTSAIFAGLVFVPIHIVNPSRLTVASVAIGYLLCLGFCVGARRWAFPDWKLRARNRIDLFYGLIVFALLVLAWVLNAVQVPTQQS